MKQHQFSFLTFLGSLFLASELIQGVSATEPVDASRAALKTAAAVLARILEDEPTPAAPALENPALENPALENPPAETPPRADEPSAPPSTTTEPPTETPPPADTPSVAEPPATDTPAIPTEKPSEPGATGTSESADSPPVELKPTTGGDEPQLLTPEPSAKTTNDAGKAEANNPTQGTSEKVVGPEANPVVKPAVPPLTPEQVKLREKVHDCLGYYYHQHDNVAEHSPWGLMHDLIAYGVDTKVTYGGETVNAIGFLCFNGNARGQQLFFLNRGRIDTRIGPGVQGHAGQFLSMMAQSRVKADYPMSVEGKELTIQDLIEYEQRTCEAGTELTFKLIGLAHYLDTETKWKNEAGEDWTIARLVKEELAQPIIGAACGGTHRLMGFNYAVRKREKEGRPMTGQYMRARKFLDDYFEYTFYLQNEDGSFSTDFFRGRNSYGDINLRIETSGHILEWLVASLSNEQLRDPRVTKAVDYLATTMLRNRLNDWEIGPRGHALHALAIYSERMYGERPGTREPVLARGRKQFIQDRLQR